MPRLLTIALVASALAVPPSLAQSASPTAIAECRLPLRDAMKAAMSIPVAQRVKDPENGDMIAALQAPAFTVIGQSALGLNVRRSTVYPSTAFVTRVALGYSATKAALPKAYGKAKCDAEGTAMTYCQMNLPEDASMGRHRVTIAAEPAEGGGTMLTCLYEKLEG